MAVYGLPPRVGAQHMGVAHAPRIAHAVEELENLDGALAPQPGGIAKARRLDLACGCCGRQVASRAASSSSTGAA
jgi:hypothetical protein